MIDQNTADTLNKALDLAKQGVVAGFEQVKQLAPFVWGVARRQTVIDGIECFVGVGFILFVWSAITIGMFKMKKADYFDAEDVFFTIFISSVIACICLIVFTLNGIDLVWNPDYWTIQRVIELAKSVK